MIASRTPKKERIMNKRPSTRTAVKANCQVHPMPMTTEKVKKAFNPSPGANATGRFAQNAMTRVAMAAEMLVAVKTEFHSMPALDKMSGFTAKM